jgi:hypothetical protein
MIVFVDRIKDSSDYDDQSKWVDYGLLMYLQACLVRKRRCFVRLNKHQCTILIKSDEMKETQNNLES